MATRLKTSSGLLVVLALTAAESAFAAAPQSAPKGGAPEVGAPATPPELRVSCAQGAMQTPHSATEMAALRDCFEARKFELEAAELAKKTAGLLSDNEIFGLLGFFGTVLTGLLGFVANRWNSSASFAELYDKRAAERQQHNAKLVETLHDGASPLRLTAAATMIARLSTLRTSRGRSAAGKVAAEEYSYLSTIAFAALRDDKLPELIAKYLADNLVGALRLRRRRLLVPSSSRMSAYDLQKVHMKEAYWGDVDARGVDFFGAHLRHSSFRRADLRKAVFYDADLTRVVLIGADLRGANFKNAILHGADLSGADLRGALHLETAQLDADTKWDARTKWPQGFTPPATS